MNNAIIPYGKQNITKEDINAVIETLQSDFLTQGPKIKEFEDQFAQYVGSKYAVAVSNGTAALHLCAMALNVKPGHKVITTPITFAASSNCIKYCGGDVVFVDIDPETFLMDINKVRELLENSPIGTYKGIVPVDFGGRPVNLEEFHSLAKQYNLWIIEDACHAPGAFFMDSKGNKQKSGNGNFAELAIFSFHPVKHIASGEGGMITTNDESLYERLKVLRTHGITRSANDFKNTILEAGGNVGDTSYPGWYMEMQELGYNYRITDFQSALGLTQLARAKDGLIKRIEIAQKYDKAFLNNSKIVSPQLQLNNKYKDQHAYHLYIIKVENRLGLYNFLRERNIFAQVHYYPTHLMPYYKKFGWEEGDMPHSENYYSKCLSLPMYPTLTNEEQEFVIASIKSFLEVE
jgi:UDP-4-amino-4,6-dideoxy-N-acetyl-beta-L-altrosamine transaminase